ncbi:lipid A biosynthesis lauroyl acyltransferase [Campylobacter sp. MIT 21-1685]|uniref:lipid A biosynthesis lauroyl acyltransferase n=1 Tax=unclassified Campylobacter TaxID=2593542 RepID=UPI00224ACD4D|nr:MULTISPECIES: lipid A biosynthesis lauroyl acyltransferase [unclassified Campylobacter]MCX2683199.1 lipid A biosynthesis lauroyl acyltransferase [Campylobacter sp. MIT 21-1684]MCX2751481.1 lipid A biosynthesis lauroyl acyltransferase [Campylobacter sp. MIT 21-1682]MCX2807680.1 lipid A biosynthesis lauroyl acyltransferase [Campylobacter sp. MIT 21-1685]
MTFKDILYLSAYYASKFLLAMFSKKALLFLSKKIAWLVFHLNTKHRKIIDVNLQLCFPQKDESERRQIALKIYENFARFGLDFLRNQNATKEQILEKVCIENEEILQHALRLKKNIVFITAHYGNWELCPLVYAAKFGAISVVERPLDSKIMNTILRRNRTQFDIELIDKKQGVRPMLRALNQNRTLGLLTDQEGGENESMELEFFGRKVRYLIGGSILAKKTKAVLIPAFIYQNEQGTYTIKIFEAMDSAEHSKEELTLYQAQCCEQMIRFKPDEYFFFHKRFKAFHLDLYQK